MTVLLPIVGIILTGAVWKGFATLRAYRRPGPDNNWINEAYAAREDSGSWAESSLAPRNAPDPVSSSIIPGVGQ